MKYSCLWNRRNRAARLIANAGKTEAEWSRNGRVDEADKTRYRLREYSGSTHPRSTMGLPDSQEGAGLRLLITDITVRTNGRREPLRVSVNRNGLR